MKINSRDLLLSSYDYELDLKLIAQRPVQPRHQAKLMVVPGVNQDISFSSHRKVWDFLDELRSGDLLVMNNTRVLKARLRVRLSNGTFGEILLLQPCGEGKWLCLGKPARKMLPGDFLWIQGDNQAPLRIQIISKDLKSGGRVLQFPGCFFDRENIEQFLEKYGEVPLPPYIKSNERADLERYQTTYATRPGAVAAPTAGLHLSKVLLDELTRKGIHQAKVTLHVGLGTFRPLEDEDLSNLELHSEWAEVNEEVVLAIEKCRARNGRVFAVGTTTVRALESSYLIGQGTICSFKGEIDLVIKPGYRFGVVDGLLTNFHLPKSSLLLLVSAFLGRERLLELYREAIKRQYRFYSYGDAMLITPEAVLDEARPYVEAGS